jgi:hypothetical protein
VRSSRQTGHDTHIGGRRFEVGLSSTLGSSASNPTTIAVRYEVQSGGNSYDAFAVAQSCIDDWRNYLSGKGLL